MFTIEDLYNLCSPDVKKRKVDCIDTGLNLDNFILTGFPCVFEEIPTRYYQCHIREIYQIDDDLIYLDIDSSHN